MGRRASHGATRRTRQKRHTRGRGGGLELIRGRSACQVDCEAARAKCWLAVNSGPVTSDQLPLPAGQPDGGLPVTLGLSVVGRRENFSSGTPEPRR
jgi:hypothetical protein